MKRFLKFLPIILVVVLVFSGNVFATNEYISPNLSEPATAKDISAITTLAWSGWKTLKVIIQILSIAAIMFAGLRYMFTSASQKAEIKKSLGILVVGATLVFACSTIIGLVVDVVVDTRNVTTTQTQK